MSKLMDKIREAKMDREKEYVVGIARDDDDRVSVVILNSDNNDPIVIHTVSSSNIRQINVALLYAIENLGLQLRFAIDRNFHCCKIISYLVSYKQGHLVYMDTHETWKEKFSRWLKFKRVHERHGVQLTTVLRKLKCFPTLDEFFDKIGDTSFGAYLCALYVKERL